MTAIDDDPDVTVRLTEPEAIPNVRIVLELCASGRLQCSEKTWRPTAASVTGLALLLAAGEFYPHEPIAAYAWPLLVQASSLAELAGNRLQLDHPRARSLDSAAVDDDPRSLATMGHSRRDRRAHPGWRPRDVDGKALA